ncbi:MAG: hypothetical protein IJB94_07760 [Clostridia bacterium]|nr:hypothetical protein [Clostridia bacterium]
MKERTVKVKVRPRRLTRAERKRIKRSQRAAAELALCRQAIEFHKAYLAIEMEYEQANYDELQARLAQLQNINVEELVETEETFDEIKENEELA